MILIYIQQSPKIKLVIKVLWFILFKMRLSTCFHCHHLPGQSHEISGSCSKRNALSWPCNSFCLRDRMSKTSWTSGGSGLLSILLGVLGLLWMRFVLFLHQGCPWWLLLILFRKSGAHFKSDVSARTFRSSCSEFGRVPFTWIYYRDILSIRFTRLTKIMF